MSNKMALDALKDFDDALATWANAYPEKVFPEPDLAKAAKLLEAGGMTLDAISASSMRHIAKTMHADFADCRAAIAALEAEPQGWRPISEAPKTSKTILVYCAERENIYTVTWVRDEEFPWSGKWKHLMGEYLNEVPTHYLPTDALPTPPKD